MGNFFTDPFGGTFAGRVYTKVARGAAGDSSYSILNPEKNNKYNVGQKLSTNDKFVDDSSSRPTVDSAKKFTTNEWGESVPIDRSQPQEQPSTWQKVKTAVSNWWNKDKSVKSEVSAQKNYINTSTQNAYEIE